MPQLRREKIDLENTLEQEQEMLVNKLWKRMDKVEQEKRYLFSSHTHTHTHTQPTPPTVLISSIAHCLPLTVLVEMYFYGGKVFIDMWGLIGRLEGATTDNCSPDLEHVLDKFLH